MDLIRFYEKYVEINLKEYPNIGLDLPLGAILLVAFIAVLITTVIINYRRAILHLTVSKLLRYDAIGEENAKNLDALKINKRSVRLSLNSGGQFAKIIGIKGKQEYTYEEYTTMMKNKTLKEEAVDYRTAELFVKEDSLPLAKRIVDMSSPSVLSTVLMCVLTVAIYVIILLLSPEILTLINNMLA